MLRHHRGGIWAACEEAAQEVAIDFHCVAGALYFEMAFL